MVHMATKVSIRDRLLAGVDSPDKELCRFTDTLTPEQLSVVESLSDPLDFRTDSQLRKETGISATDLRNLKRDPVIKRMLNKDVEESLRNSKHAVIKTLMRKAVSEGDTQALKMCLEIMGIYAQQVEVKAVNLSIFKNMPIEELLSAVKELQTDFVLFEDEAQSGEDLYGAKRTYSGKRKSG